jgi:hypothetical protein
VVPVHDEEFCESFEGSGEGSEISEVVLDERSFDGLIGGVRFVVALAANRRGIAVSIETVEEAFAHVRLVDDLLHLLGLVEGRRRVG